MSDLHPCLVKAWPGHIHGPWFTTGYSGFCCLTSGSIQLLWGMNHMDHSSDAVLSEVACSSTITLLPGTLVTPSVVPMCRPPATASPWRSLTLPGSLALRAGRHRMQPWCARSRGVALSPTSDCRLVCHALASMHGREGANTVGQNSMVNSLARHIVHVHQPCFCALAQLCFLCACVQGIPGAPA
jgi:hypothetical protein